MKAESRTILYLSYTALFWILIDWLFPFPGETFLGMILIVPPIIIIAVFIDFFVFRHIKLKLLRVTYSLILFVILSSLILVMYRWEEPFVQFYTAVRLSVDTTEINKIDLYKPRTSERQFVKNAAALAKYKDVLPNAAVMVIFQCNNLYDTCYYLQYEDHAELENTSTTILRNTQSLTILTRPCEGFEMELDIAKPLYSNQTNGGKSHFINGYEHKIYWKKCELHPSPGFPLKFYNYLLFKWRLLS